MCKFKKHRIAKYFYHITLRENLESILSEGMIPGRGRSLLGEVEFPGVLWMDSSLTNLLNWVDSGEFPSCALLKVNSRYLDRAKFSKSSFRIMGKNTWWKYQGEIPLEALEIVQFLSTRTALCYNS